MDYEEELSLKRRRVLDAFVRIGGITLPELTITGADTLDGYRNKVQFPVGTRRGAPVAGFFRARTHEVIPADGCKLQPDCAERLKRAVLAWMQAHCIAAYDEKTHTGLVRHIYLRLGAVSGQALCCVVLNAKKTPHPEALVRAVREAKSGVALRICKKISKENKNMEEIRIGIIGTGTQATYYMKKIFGAGKIERAHVAAVCDIDEAALSAFRAATGYDGPAFSSSARSVASSSSTNA